MSPALPSRTPSLRRLSRPTASVGVALALALGLSACGTGLRAQTYQERATADATNEALGALAVRNLSVLPRKDNAQYAVGSEARATFVLVNEGTEADRLTSVTSDGATSVAVAGPDGKETPLEVPAQGTLTGYSFVLRGLTAPLRPGQYVKMKLSFEVNGSEEMLVPVAVTQSAAPRRQGYKAGETDSAGNPVVEEGGAEEGASDRPELDSDGGDAPSGDAVPDTQSDPIGDINGGASAATPPPEG